MGRTATTILEPTNPVQGPGKPNVELKPTRQVASSAAEGNGRATDVVKPRDSLPAAAAELQALQRQRVWYVKSRIMIGNRLQATVAGTLGYHAGMNEADRAKAWKAADALIERIKAGEEHPTLRGIVLSTLPAIGGYEEMEAALEKKMTELAKRLPVAEWAAKQRGFGLFALARIVGETGDLSNYANPAKVWRRMGCAPCEHDGKTLMGSTWRRGKEGKLPAEAWEGFGYSPRRRSVAYVIGEGLLKMNDGPYRKRYDEGKAAFAARHPEYKPLRCHLHGMLVMVKMLLRDLWAKWNRLAVAEM